MVFKKGFELKFWLIEACHRILSLRLKDTWFVLGMLVLLAVGATCTYYGQSWARWWLFAPTAPEFVRKLELTPQAVVIRNQSFQPGLPHAEVGLAEFKRTVADGPYAVSIHSVWFEGEDGSNRQYLSSRLVYTAKVQRAGMEMYLVAREYTPNYGAQFSTEKNEFQSAYNFETKFDPTRLQFFSVVIGTNYHSIIGYVALVVAGFIMFGIGALMAYFGWTNELASRVPFRPLA